MNYIRNSILNPTSQVVEGFQPIMPTFKGQVTEEQLNVARRVYQIAERRNAATYYAWRSTGGTPAWRIPSNLLCECKRRRPTANAATG